MVESRTGRRLGFTLIELTLAIVLLALGLLALTGALAHALRETTRARVLHSALRQAESVADSLGLLSAPGSGEREYVGFRLEWSAVACGSATCMQVSVRTPTDSLSIATPLHADST